MEIEGMRETCAAFWPRARAATRRACQARRSPRRSAHRRRVLDTVLAPELVQPSRYRQPGVRSEISLEHFTIVADERDGTHHPVSGEAKLLAIVAFAADESPDAGVLRFHSFFDSLRAHAKLLGIDHGEVRPLDDVEPLVIALANHRPQRLLGDDIRQNDVTLGIGELEPLAVKLGDIAGERVTHIGIIGIARVADARQLDRLVRHRIGVEKIGEIELARRAFLDADLGPFELERRHHIARVANQKALSVIVRDRSKAEPQLRLARYGPRGVSREEIDLTRLEACKALRGGERNELHLAGVVEYRGCNRAAKVDVEPRPAAAGVDGRKAIDALAHTAVEQPSFLDRLQGLRKSSVYLEGERRQCQEANNAFHDGTSH